MQVVSLKKRSRILYVFFLGLVIPSGLMRKPAFALTRPLAPSVMSASHPDSEEWYKDRTLELSWTKDTGVTGFSYELDEKEDTIPDDASDTDGTGINLIVEDGIWYFHLKAYNTGWWSETTHFKVKVDSLPPIFTLNSSYEDKGDLQPEITFEAQDHESGMDYYEVRVDGEAHQNVESPFKTEILAIGEHEATVAAYDLAQNKAETTFSFTIDSLEPPSVTELLVERLFFGPVSQRIVVRGTAPSETKIIVQISDIFVSEEVYADSEGFWEYIYDGDIVPGDYAVRVMNIIGEVESEYSELYPFTISDEEGLSFLPKTGKELASGILFLLGGLIFGAFAAAGILILVAKRKGLPQTFRLPAFFEQNPYPIYSENQQEEFLNSKDHKDKSGLL